MELRGNPLNLEPEAGGKVLYLGKKLYRWSRDRTYRLKDIYNLLFHSIVLTQAWRLVSGNKGSRTAGVDGVTKKTVEEYGPERWLTEVQLELKQRRYEPQPISRRWIPKPGRPG